VSALAVSLRGKSPRICRVVQASKFELVINGRDASDRTISVIFHCIFAKGVRPRESKRVLGVPPRDSAAWKIPGARARADSIDRRRVPDHPCRLR